MEDHPTSVDLTPIVSGIGLALAVLVNELVRNKIIDGAEFARVLDLAPESTRQTLSDDPMWGDIQSTVFERILLEMRGASGRPAPRSPFKPIIIRGGKSE